MQADEICVHQTHKHNILEFVIYLLYPTTQYMYMCNLSSKLLVTRIPYQLEFFFDCKGTRSLGSTS